VTTKVRTIAAVSGLAVVGIIAGVIIAVTGGSSSGGGDGSSNPYQADYAQGERLGQQFIDQYAGTLTYNVELLPSQCQQGWSLVNSKPTGTALSNLRRGFMHGCEIAGS